MKLEYKVIKLSVTDVRTSSESLTELAAEGWRVQLISPINITVVIVLLWRESK